MVGGDHLAGMCVILKSSDRRDQMNNEDITHGKLIEILKEMNELGCSAIVQDEKGRLSRIKEVKQTEEGLFIMTELVVE
jgi:hypothetical protein